jgi:hypothetical protein
MSYLILLLSNALSYGITLDYGALHKPDKHLSHHFGDLSVPLFFHRDFPGQFLSISFVS